MYEYLSMYICIYAAKPAFLNTPAHMNTYMCVCVCVCMHVCKYIYAVKPSVSIYESWHTCDIYDRERERKHWNMTT